MMAQSATVASVSRVLPETWQRFYNGPNVGLIDVEIAAVEMPWLVGMSVGVTIDTHHPVGLCRLGQASA